MLNYRALWIFLFWFDPKPKFSVFDENIFEKIQFFPNSKYLQSLEKIKSMGIKKAVLRVYIRGP